MKLSLDGANTPSKLYWNLSVNLWLLLTIINTCHFSYFIPSLKYKFKYINLEGIII